MTTGALITETGKKIVMDRTYNAGPTRTAPSTVCLGVGQTVPVVGDTDLDNPIPITNGTVNDDCNSTFTGSNGGTTSTNNTSVYKDGGGVTDVTAQNLVTTGSNVNKTWTKTVDSNFTATMYSGFWFYIKDATALAKFKTSGATLTARWRSDSSNYYEKTWTAADLSTGWNWLTTGSLAINGLTTTGTPGTLDEFYINVETNVAADAFVAGDVVIDLVRTWQDSDLVKNVSSVTVDESTFQAIVRTEIATTEAVGFAIDSSGLKNSDGDLFSLDAFNEKGKGINDEFVKISRHKHA